jgi:DNA-binding CsgD family transcriptional regulator/tetratricopeptide (TPR) repeat protein
VLRDASRGTGGAVLVRGEAGIGKSRLMAELEARAVAAGAMVLVGECLELAEGQLAFAPIVAAFRTVIGEPELVAGLDPALRAATAALWPAPGPSAALPGQREQLFEAVYWMLARLAARQPVLLVVEDVHWIDPSSRDLLAFIVHNARRDRVMVLVTYSSDELLGGHPLRAFLAELERSGRSQRLELEGLPRADVAEQIAAITGRQPSPDAVDAISARSEGNPFFVEELVAGAEPTGATLPASLREALLLRIEGLSSFGRQVMAGAAAIGRSFDHRLLTSLVSGSEDELLGALRDAAAYHLLVPVGGGVAYRFRHALLREAIYEDTLPGERLRLHRAIARALSDRPELAGASIGAAAELAHHWYAARDLPAALAASARAAAEAARMYAHPEALRHLERVLELWDEVPGAEELAGCDRVSLLLRTSQMAEHVGDDGLSLQLAERARRRIDDRVEPVRAAAAEGSIGRALWNGGRADQALEHLAHAVRLVPAHPPSVERADALAAYGRLLMLNGLFRRALVPLEEALALSDQFGAQSAKASALNTLTLVYSQLGDNDRAIAAGREGLRIATELGDSAEIARGYINGSQSIDNAGRVEEALALGREGIAAAHRVGVDRAAGDQLRWQAAWRMIRLSRFAEAEQLVEKTLERATIAFNVAAGLNQAGYLAAIRGDPDRGEELLERAWELMQHSGGFQLIGLALAWRISLCLWCGQTERANDLAADAIERIAAAEGQLIYTGEAYWLVGRVHADRAEAARIRGREAEATQAAAAAKATADGLAHAIATYLAGGAPPEALGFAAMLRGERERAYGNKDVESWRSAAQQFNSLKQPYRAAYAEMRAAEALSVAAAPAREVAAPLRRAYAVAVELGVAPFRQEVEALARRTGLELGGSDRDDFGTAKELGLSRRELEVLALVAEGHTNREIAQELFITEKTASAHVSHILMKLGVANRAAAATAAHRLGLTRERTP